MRNETLARLAWSPFLDGRFSLLAGTVFLHKTLWLAQTGQLGLGETIESFRF